MPPDIEINAIGGTSAGAIVAALVAIGKRGNDLKAILQSKDLFELVDKADSERLERIKSVWEELAPLIQDAKSGKMPWISMGLTLRRHRKVLKECQQVWAERGMHSSARLAKFLTESLEGKKFKDIVVDDLKIVAADVKNRSFEIYDKKGYGGMFIAEAVLASASIPIFFTPFQYGSRYLVDGGTLSNFPSFLFAQAKFKTIGLRLIDLEPPGTIDSTESYLLGLALTMAEAHDKQRGNPPHFRAWEIATPSSIGATKFTLNQKEAEDLFNAGQQAGRGIQWDQFASEQPIVSYYDPLPQDALQFSIGQAYALWELYSKEELYVDTLIQNYVFTAKIDKDWTVHYERSGSLEVEGSRSLILTRTKLESPGQRFLESLVEVESDGVFKEINSDGSPKAPLIRIPAFNGETEKGFLLFYSPPIAPGHGKRWFRTKVNVEKEFAENVARGEVGTISYGVKQLGKKHSLKLTVRVLLEAGLPDLDLTTEWKEKPISTGRFETDGHSKKTYLVHECQYDTEIHDKFGIDILVRLRKS
jgi:predicted acylesterase/phospholipase RssA